MKKSLKIVLLVMLAIIWNMITTSLAANEQVTLTPSKSNVESGDTFEIVVSQQSEGLTGFESTLNYDTNLFTLTKKELGEGWIDIGNETKLDAMANSPISSGDVFKLTFAVKENVSTTTSEIKLNNVKLYKTSSDKIDFGNKSINMNVEGSSESENSAVLSRIEITKAPNTVNYKEGERFNPAGMEVTAVYNDNSLKKVTNYTYLPNTALKTDNKLITISYEENGVVKSATQPIKVSTTDGNQAELKGISLDRTDLTLVLGITTKMNLIAYANPSNATLPEIVWTSSDEKIAKVEKTDVNGSIAVVPVSVGNVTITAKTKDGKYSATCKVTVNPNGNVSGNVSDDKDNTTTSSVLPATGAKTKYILIVAVALVGVGVVSYIGYKKYKEI